MSSTRWSGGTDSERPLAEYPRPQMVRQDWMNLNGCWDLEITDRQQQLPKQYSHTIVVPYAVETAVSTVEQSVGPDDVLWYRRSFSIPKAWSESEILLHSEAVDWECEVLIDGELAGNHHGGYLPFTCNITSHLKEAASQHEVVVRAWDPTDTGWQQCGLQRLNPERGFHAASSGIRQTVWLEPVSSCAISDIILVPQCESGGITVSVIATGGSRVIYTVLEAGRKIAARAAGPEETVKLQIPFPKMWHPDSPHLYRLKIALYHGRTITDSVESYFALRSFSSRTDRTGKSRFFLNNMPLLLNAVLYHPFWPGSGLTAPSDAAVRDELELIRKLGFNSVRCHATVASRRWYHHCDSLGLLVIQDMVPNAGCRSHRWFGKVEKQRTLRQTRRDSEVSRSDFRRELRELVVTLRNTPSLCMWVVFSEGWGQFEATAISEWLKGFDTDRLVVQADGAGDVTALPLGGIRSLLPHRDSPIAAVLRFPGLSNVETGHSEAPADNLKHFLDTLYRRRMKRWMRAGLGLFVYDGFSDLELDRTGLLSFDRRTLRVDTADLQRLLSEVQQEFQDLV